MKNKFKISLDLKPYIRSLLSKREEPFRIKKEGDQYYVLTNMSGTRFHKVVQRARCMKLTQETGMLHITKRESENEELIAALQTEYDTSSYVIAGVQKQD